MPFETRRLAELADHDARRQRHGRQPQHAHHRGEALDAGVGVDPSFPGRGDHCVAVEAVAGSVGQQVSYGGARGTGRLVEVEGTLLSYDGSLVVVTKADAKFVQEVKDKTAPLEQAWVKAAEGKGLKNAAKVLAEFRGEIAKLEK